MSAFIDIHQHFLYGLDDGAGTESEMQNMLVEACRDGIHSIIATPHVAPGIAPFSIDLFQRRMDEANALIRANNLNLEIMLGAEVLFTYQTQRFLSEHRIPTLAETNKILLELSPDVSYSEIETAVISVLRAGYLPVLAHVERYACLMRARRRMAQLKREYDVFYQVNTGCIRSGRDSISNKTIERAIQDGLIDFVATDAHNLHSRSSMKQAYSMLEALFGIDVADQLTGNRCSIADFLDD